MTQSKIHRKFKSALPWLDVLALFAWGVLLLKYWVTGQLSLLIHPNYFGLVFATGAVLLILGGVRAWQLRNRRRSRQVSETVDHITLFPVGWASALLIVSAILGLVIAPAVLTSQTALQRGISDLPLTRAQPQSFRMSTQPEERSLIEWVRTLNAYPEPDAYVGQKAKVQGFVVHPPELPNDYLLISRFVLTCCAVDAYPVGIPVKLDQSRDAYASDTWLEIEGAMISETLASRDPMAEKPFESRQLVLEASSIKLIPTPANPYEY